MISPQLKLYIPRYLTAKRPRQFIACSCDRVIYRPESSRDLTFSRSATRTDWTTNTTLKNLSRLISGPLPLDIVFVHGVVLQ